MDTQPTNSAPSLIAYRVPGYPFYPRIVPASPDRFWMDVSTNKWANRCLPLRIANQSGWAILNPREFDAVWGGKPQLDSLQLRTQDGARLRFVKSLFGYGVITWTIPYLFRTPAGYNLLVRGPANESKDGVAPLDGIVETDWLPFPFTMNWRFTRPQRKVRFDRDEPICVIMPVRRGDVEAFDPEIRNLESDPVLLGGYQAWNANRQAAQKVAFAHAQGEDVSGQEIPRQGHYLRGEGHHGERAQHHQNKLEIRPFREVEPAVTTAEPPQAAGGTPSLLKRLLGRSG